MKKKLIAIVILSIVLLVLFDLLIMDFISEQKLDLVMVPVASHNIFSRKQITEEDITYVRVPSGYLSEDCLIDPKKIAGSYNLVNNIIPKGSFFYAYELESVQEMSDYPIFLLGKDQVAYSLKIHEIDCLEYCLREGARVDIFLTVNRQGDYISDLLMENVLIIGVFDHNGTDVKRPDSEAIIDSLLLAIDKEHVSYLNSSKATGRLSLFLTSDSYSDKQARLNRDNELISSLE